MASYTVEIPPFGIPLPDVAEKDLEEEVLDNEIADDDDGFVDEVIEESNYIGEEGEGIRGTNGRRGTDLQGMIMPSGIQLVNKIAHL